MIPNLPKLQIKLGQFGSGFSDADKLFQGALENKTFILRTSQIPIKNVSDFIANLLVNNGYLRFPSYFGWKHVLTRNAHKM